MDIRITLVQFDILWEDKTGNLEKAENILAGLAGKTDIVIFPEMFTTGFSMNSEKLAEENSGQTISRIKQWASGFDLAICGSFIAKEKNLYFNRGFFISPGKETYYDKKHLFRMGEEPEHFSAGNKRLIVEHKGFSICLLICYDLRFPVWARNVNNEYDLLVYVANWPEVRINAWKILLKARAVENMAYVCGVNRIGKDETGLIYNGNSILVDYKGNEISQIENNIEQVKTFTISKEEVDKFRNKFPVWKDADLFEIKN